MRRLGPVVAGLVGLLLWQLAAAGTTTLATPEQSAARLVELLQTAPFRADIMATAGAFALAAILSMAGGLALGVALGLGRGAALVCEPILVSLYTLPKVTLYPVVLLAFGLGLPAKVAFGVMHGLIPLALFTMRAIAAVPIVLVRTGLVLRLTRRQMLLDVVLPAIQPDIAAGLRLALSLSLLGVLIGEMFASVHGLGHRAMQAMAAGDLAGVLAIASLLAGIAVTLNLIIPQRRRFRS